MATVGSATLNFGSIGSSTPEASVAVTGQAGIGSSSKVEAWVRLVSTTEHSTDEVLAEQLDVLAGNIVAGTGFTIYGSPREGVTYGTYTIDWVWV